MAFQHHISIWQEADMIERFARGYRAKFATLIEDLNANPAQTHITDLQCLRLCVEAIDVMLENQSRLADALKQLNSGYPQMKSAA